MTKQTSTDKNTANDNLNIIAFAVLSLTITIFSLVVYSKFFTPQLSFESQKIAYISIDDWVSYTSISDAEFIDIIMDEADKAAKTAAGEGFIVLKGETVYASPDYVKIKPGSFGSRTIEEISQSYRMKKGN